MLFLCSKKALALGKRRPITFWSVRMNSPSHCNTILIIGT
nr:MAG TPA: hypothetical protein [Caudoviricetes sp.]